MCLRCASGKHRQVIPLTVMVNLDPLDAVRDKAVGFQEDTEGEVLVKSTGCYLRLVGFN